MYKLKFFKIYFSAIAFLVAGLAQGQTTGDCSQTLQKAQDTYKEGRISEIEDLLQPCLETGLNKTEKIEAYRLLTLTYLYFNEHDKAVTAMTHMLKNDPEYKIRQADPTEFVNLYNSFRTNPVVLLGAKLGANFSDIDIIKNFSLDNSAIARGSYKTNMGIQGGLTAEFPLSKKLSLVTEVLYSINKFSYKDRLFDYAEIQFPEKQVYLTLPVLLNYTYTKGRWSMYGNLGASFGYLLGAKASPVRVDSTGLNSQREIKEGEISISPLRSTISYNLVGSAGLKIKDVIGRGYIVIGFRYIHGLNNLANEKNRYSNSDLMYKYMYIDNSFKINSFQYTIGYSYPMYKPKVKVKKVKTKEE